MGMKMVWVYGMGMKMIRRGGYFFEVDLKPAPSAAARDTPRGQSPRLLMSYLDPYGMPSFAPSSPESPFPRTGDFGAGVKSHPSSHLRSQQRALAMVSGSCTTMLRGRVSWTPEMALPELTFHAAMVLYHRPTGPRT